MRTDIKNPGLALSIENIQQKNIQVMLETQ